MRILLHQRPLEFDATVTADAALEVLAGILREGDAECDDLVVLPEMWFPGYTQPLDVLLRAAAAAPALLAGAAELCRRHRVALALPLALPAAQLVYNAVVVINEHGETILTYRKTHLWGPSEHLLFSAGDDSDLGATALLGGLRVGVLICMDLEYPEPARMLGLAGAQVIIAPTALAWSEMQDVIPRCVAPTRALENHVFLAYCNLVGAGFCGASAVVGPDGLDLARAPTWRPTHDNAEASQLTVTLDPAAFVDTIARNPYFQGRRPELYKAIAQIAQ